uniref:Monosaccharide-sensing protein 3 n=1 Tax=Aegilops tauschii TaxID=37682 RepID=M8C399_AEGTA
MRGAVLVAITAAIGNMLQGVDNATIAGAVMYIKREFHLETQPAVEGLVVATSLIGATIITTFSGPVADIVGRRPMLIASSLLYFLGGLVMLWSPNVYVLLIARLIDGFGVGLAVTLVPVYISETAPPEIRGLLNTFPQFTGSAGMFMAYCMIFTMTLHPGPSWRTMLGVLAGPSLIYLALTVFYLPESPRWLVSKGRMKEARVVLEKLRGREDVSGEMALLVEGLGSAGETEIEEYVVGPADGDQEQRDTVTLYGPEQGLSQSMLYTKDVLIGQSPTEPAFANPPEAVATKAAASGPRWRELLEPGVRHALFCGMMIQILQQFSGINGVLYYTPQILDQAGVSVLLAGLGLSADSTSILISGLTTLLMMPSIGLAMWLMDLSGRRTLLLTTIPVLIFSLVILIVANVVPMATTVHAALSTGSVIIYFCCFVMGFGPIPNILCAEIFPTRVRGLCIALCSLTFWIGDIIVTYSLPVMLNSIGLAGVFGIYACVCCLALVFVALKVPETKGLPLEVIIEFFNVGAKGIPEQMD